MAKLYNRAKMTTATTGTGTITLGSASSGYQTFASAGVANGDVVSYVIEDNSGDVEFGTGTYTSTGTTLSRTVTQSCISGTWGTTAISLSGTANVFLTALAADLYPVPVSNGGTGRTSLGTGVTSAMGNAVNSASGLIALDANQNASIAGTLAMGSSFVRNRIINGGFAIDQRNAAASQTITAAAALAYTVDRWYAYCTGANVTGQQVAGTAPAKNAYKFTGASSNTLVGFGQRIEQLNSYDLASGAVTISAYMTASSNTTITWYLYGPSSTADTFGTIASPSITQIATGTFSVTSTRTQFTATISAASMSGFNKGLELRFVASSGLGNSVTWTIEDCQVEVGSIATPFERRLYGQELALCQRYYQKWSTTASAQNFPVSGQAYGSDKAVYVLELPVPPRAAPTGIETTGAFCASTSVYAQTGSGTLSIYSAGTGSSTLGMILNGLTGLVAGNCTHLLTNSSGATIAITGCEL